jgi:hypothetical protein
MTAALLSAYRWRRWLALTAEERALLLRSLVLLVQARYTLARRSFEPLAGASAAQAVEGTGAAALLPAGVAAPVATHRQRAHHVARLVAYAAALCPVRASGSQRAWVLWQLLSREGVPCLLRSPAAAAQGLGDLAWVECHEQVLHEVADPYQPFPAGSPAVVPARKG